MAGNSQRRGAVRKTGSKKGATVGSGGQRRRGLEGKGPTPKASDRPNHKAHKFANAAAKSGSSRPQRPQRRTKASSEMVAGRNSVLEALRADIPVATMYVAGRIDADDRVREALKIAGERGIPILETPRGELDRLTDDAVHQGVVVPARRSVGMTASAWKTSAGAAARIPVAQVSNLNQALKDFKKAGFFVIGLDMDGDVELPDLELASEPLVIVVGSEGKGLSKLVGENCDQIVSVPMSSAVESLNAGIAAGVTLYEVARRRR